MTRNLKQNLHGVILLDKPTGMSSNRALQKVKHCLGAKKAGHTGSLDPLATGLLPLCLGQATKVSEYLLGSSKRYETVIKLGQSTDTLDAEGVVLESRPVHFSDDDLERALQQFRGQIEQVPPMYSALKKDGQPLYKLARQGETIVREPRKMTVHELTAERVDEEHLRLSVHCSSGFYIRSLADDLGEALGCGAHVVELRRTAIKSLSVDQATTLQYLLESEDPRAAIQPIDSLIQDFPRLILTEEQFEHLTHGRRPSADRPESEQLTRFYAPNGTLFGVGCVTNQNTLKCEKRFVLDE